jgi:hypothetical protein
VESGQVHFELPRMTHPVPQVAPGTWIRVGQSVDGYVFNVDLNGSLEVGYYQNGINAVKETVVWDGRRWQFKHSGPNASYLRGEEEALVKRGPIRP